MTVVTELVGEQTRARYPDEAGYVERDGVRVFYEVYGAGEPTVFLLPTWSIIHSRHWKLQIPYLARHFRVLTFDGRGNGRSDRPEGVTAYAEPEHAADALAVMDATDTERAVLVSLSLGAQRALLLAAGRPDRVAAAAFISPSVSLGKPLPSHIAHSFEDVLDTDEGWAKYNRHYWVRDYRGFLEFFFSSSSPSRTRPSRSRTASAGVSRRRPRRSSRHGWQSSWARKRPAHSVKASAVRAWSSRAARTRSRGPRAGSSSQRPRAAPSSCSKDPVTGRMLATRSRSTSCSGSSRASRREPRRWTRANSRRRRALYVSSPIGLGHAQRDVAIARELRQLVPDLEIDWLAQDPVTRVLEAEGERVHPLSAELANESGHMESESAEHDLHCFQAWRRMDEILVANFMVFHDVVREENYDLWIGDEAWELDYYLHENPEEKRAAYVWLTDFVGWLPMEDGGEREAFLTADYNAEMIEHIARFPRVRDQALFVGNPDDVVARRIRPRPPADPRLDRAALRLRRLRLGLRPGGVCRPGEAAGRARLWAGRARLHRHRRRLRRRRPPSPARRRRLSGGEGARARATHGRRRRPADRPRGVPEADGPRGARLRPQPLPPPGRLRPRGRPGRADDLDGADRQPAAVPLLPAPPPLRAELPRPPPARALRRRPGDGLRDRHACRDRAGDRRGDRQRGRLPPVETDGAAKAAARIAEML